MPGPGSLRPCPTSNWSRCWWSGPGRRTGQGGLLQQLTKRVLESALEGEITDHLGYEKHDPAGKNNGNSRNGTRAKTVLTDVGPVEVKVPRDTAGSFEPQIVKKRRSPAATKAVILDCCHAELGLDADFHFQSGRRSDGPPAGRRADFAGASSRYEKAKTPLGGRLTHFARTPGDEGTDRALGMICPHAARFAEQRTRAACDRLPRGAARVPEAGPEGGDGVPGSPGVALRRGRRATPGRQRRSPVKRPTLLITSSL